MEGREISEVLKAQTTLDHKAFPGLGKCEKNCSAVLLAWLICHLCNATSYLLHPVWGAAE